MTETNADQELLEAHERLQHAEQIAGSPHDKALVEPLEALAKLLRERKKLLDAANIEARARVIRETLPPPDEAEEKTCPFCAETIKVKAIKCRFCGSDLPMESRPKQVVSAETARMSLADERRLKEIKQRLRIDGHLINFAFSLNFELGYLYWKYGLTSEASDAFEKCTEIAPQLSEAVRNKFSAELSKLKTDKPIFEQGKPFTSAIPLPVRQKGTPTITLTIWAIVIGFLFIILVLGSLVPHTNSSYQSHYSSSSSYSANAARLCREHVADMRDALDSHDWRKAKSHLQMAVVHAEQSHDQDLINKVNRLADGFASQYP